MESNTLPKKLTTNEAYAEAAQAYIKAKRDNAGGAKPFFKLVYGRDPVGNESVTLNNQVNRGKYAPDFVGLMMDKLGLEDVTLGEFYKGNNED